MAPTLLLTRPLRQAKRFAQACRERLGQDIDVVVSPLLRIEPVALDDAAKSAKVLVFTSENGVLSYADQSPANARLAYCVGPRTAEVAKDQGFRTITGPGDGISLVERILADAPQTPIFHAHGQNVRINISAVLDQNGLRALGGICYTQIRQDFSVEAISLTAKHARVVAALFSPNSAKILADSWPANASAPDIAALSQAVLDAWSGPPPARSKVAERPSQPYLLDALAAIWSDPSA